MNQLMLAIRLFGLCALYCLRYRKALKLSFFDTAHAIKKTFFLAWCYIAFVPKHWPSRLNSASLSAFVSVAYDVFTDWHGISANHRSRLSQILEDLVPADLKEIALKLYGKEEADNLEPHGLDRGFHALRFILKVFEYEPEDCNVQEAGYVLQIIDDLIDFEEDCENDHINFLRTSSKDSILDSLYERFDRVPIETWCSRSFAFRKAFERAESRVQLFVSERSVLGNDAFAGPCKKVNDYENREDTWVGKHIAEPVEN